MVTKDKLPARLFAAFNWIDAAGEWDVFRSFKTEEQVEVYCRDAAQNAVEHEVTDVTAEDIYALRIHLGIRLAPLSELELDLREILWPNGDPDCEWSPDTLDTIAARLSYLRPEWAPGLKDPHGDDSQGPKDESRAPAPVETRRCLAGLILTLEDEPRAPGIVPIDFVGEPGKFYGNDDETVYVSSGGKVYLIQSPDMRPGQPFIPLGDRVPAGMVEVDGSDLEVPNLD